MLQIKVPPLGESIVQATISRWLKREGDAVQAGDTLVELETDKVTVEVPALKAGVLVKRSKQEGEIVGVDEVIGEIDETAVPAAASATAPQSTEASQPAPAEQPPREAVPERRAAPVSEVRAAPSAQREAAAQGVDLSTVSGTGRGGVVSKADVIDAVAARSGSATEAPKAAPQAAATPRPAAAAPAAGNGARETREAMTTRRKRIAEHLLEAQHATAHLTTFNEIDMSAVETLRGRIKERIEKEHGVRLSFMPFFVKACCQALKQFPVVNAQIDGDSIIYKHYVHMGIAVASDAGLVVPNVKDADRKGMIQIGREIVEIAKRARDGKLTMDDLTGGTFTITNGGVFGSLVSTPIINYPQVAILGLHKIQERPIVVDGEIVARPMMYVALSYDHRIIDGQQAVLFLVRVKELVEDPALLAVD
ncbi:MAG TPA: 2-oxoglutarate dehydrogenase complex dihydrolipoyllysine-residue succinyltransferase [Gemmatimonadaceae bacterium]|jgi:2-oxoglutarate dehydrogenase E2 component (dihydrolipoamide succinyltransferase)|nr:2-oxoglutarate dehydrogenase complex dihydrolipoyllysine-residue succinyltransferase [Gemmatimonadaceae bacterium]